MPQSCGTEPGGVGVMGRFSSAQSRCFCQLHGPHTSHGSVSDMSSSSRQSSLKGLVLPPPGKGSFIKIKHYPTVKSHLTPNISIVSPAQSQLYVSRRTPATESQSSCFSLAWLGFLPENTRCQFSTGSRGKSLPEQLRISDVPCSHGCSVRDPTSCKA